MVNTTIPNQQNYQNNQNFKIDIDKIYSDFITSIDNIRSCNNTNSISSKQINLTLVDADTIADARSILKSKCTLSMTPVESRCHAFFRIIGFPVCDADNKIYNPGLDIVEDTLSDRVVDDTYKLGIITNQINGFRALSIFRENNILASNSIFEGSTSIDAGVLALSSGRHVRKFISPLNKSIVFNDVTISDYQYKMNFASSVGGIAKNLTEYQDVNGNTPTQLSSFNFNHIINPFFVDPVIDLTVNDSLKLIAVPFVNDKSELKIKDGNQGYVNRPMIEQIIIERATLTGPEAAPGSGLKIINELTQIPNIASINIVNLAQTNYSLSDQTQLYKFINIIQTMMNTLIDAQKTIKKVQDIYYYVPATPSNGPEGGCTTQGVFFSSVIDPSFITYDDLAIINANLYNAIAQADSSAATVTANPDVGNFALPNTFGIPNFGGYHLPNAIGNNVQDNLNKLNNTRNAMLDQANQALKTVEIIMGEFSGLGLCDIVAIIGGLYLMPQDSLLGFLDSDALSRAQSQGIDGDSPGVLQAYTDFINTVQSFYNLMDKIHSDLSKDNGLS